MIVWAIGVILLGLVEVVESATYYVGTTGSDANSCATAQTITTPKLTIPSGLGCLASGDTLYIRTGTYTQQLLEVNFGATGTAGNIITVSNYNGEVVTLRPSGSSGTVMRFQDSTIHHVTVNGLILDGINIGGGAGGAVVFLGDAGFIDNSHDIILQNLEIKNGDHSGILAGGSSHQFINLDVHDNGRFDASPGPNGNGLYMAGIFNSIISGVNAWNNACVGIRVWNSGATPKADNNIIRNSTTHDNGQGYGLSGTAVCSSGGGGMSIGDTGNLVYNHVSYHEYIGAQSPGNAVSAKYYNSTFYNNTADIVVDAGASNVEIKNVIGGVSDGGTGTTTATNSTDTTGFVNAASADFHLQSGSSAKDAGTTLASVIADKDGISRPQGAAYDIGAYEFQAAPVSSSAISGAMAVSGGVTIQ